MRSKTSGLIFFRDWQSEQLEIRKATDTRNAQYRLSEQLDGIGAVFERHPNATVAGYEGRLYQSWLFFQFFSACLGAYTPPGTVFVHGWRGLWHVHTLAQILRMPELEAKLEETWDRLNRDFTQEELDRYDEWCGLATKHGALPALDDQDKIKQISAFLDVGFDSVVTSGQCLGAASLADDPNYQYDGGPIWVALTQYVESICDEHPEIIKALGPSDAAPTPVAPTEPSQSHDKQTAKAITTLSRPEVLQICTDNELWLAAGCRFGPIGAAAKSHIHPYFFKTKTGQNLCLVGFADGNMLIDVATWAEVGRHYYDRSVGRSPDLPKLLIMKDNPQFYVEKESFKIHHKRRFRSLPHTLTYKQ